MITAWARHLYYWVYTPCMVGVTALLSGYLLNSLWPEAFSGGFNSRLFIFFFCPVFTLGVLYIRGVMGAKAMNRAINIIPLILFLIIAILFRVQHPEGSKGLRLVNGAPVDYVFEEEQVVENGKPKVDSTGAPVMQNKTDGPVPR